MGDTPNNQLLSDPATLRRIAVLIERYHRLPFSSLDSIPGAVMEAALEIARGPNARVLKTYDFVDVVDDASHLGWQVKSTKHGTPITWKRAKIRDAGNRRRYAHSSIEAAQEVGNELIAFCNNHALESLQHYELKSIGYARLIVWPNSRATYFERPLISRKQPILFRPEDFTWRWTDGRPNASKEQQGALAGYDARQVRWFSWYSENQLHFNNEKAWWLPDGHPNRLDFPLSKKKIETEVLLEWLESLASAGSPF